MKIQHEQTDSKGSFFIFEDGKRVAEMTYSRAGTQLIIIDHTQVDDELKGKGAGLQLLMAMVDHARKQKIRILPLCPFAKSVFDKKEELRDVL